MRNQKKFLAVLTATTVMLSSTSAFAATETKGSTGAGIVENNASTVPSYNQIVLPTMPDKTYDFTLDPTGLLHTYNPDLYPTEGTFYFHSLKTPAALKNIDSSSNTDGKLYYATETESTTDNLKAALTATGGSISKITGKFYVWVPDAASRIGGGKYLLLDTSNIKNYFDITIESDGTTITAVAFKSTIKSGDSTSVCNGKVYTDGYEELPSSYDVSDYVTIKDGAIDTNETINLAVYDGSSVYTPINSSNLNTYVKYTAPVVDYQGTSDKTTIVNKSTVDTTVTATVTVTNPGTLSFVSDKTFASDTNTSVYLAITNGSTATPVELKDGVVTAEATFNLKAVDTSSAITYQSTEIDAKTGGHVYKQYEAPNVTYNKVSFYLEGAANKSASAADWDAYSESLTSTTRPSIDVVYSFKNTFGDPEVPEVTDDYIIKVNADGTASYTFVDAPDTDETGLTALSDNNQSRPGAIGTNVTYSDGVLNFNSTVVSSWLASATSVTATINGEEFTFTVKDDYLLHVVDGSISYTFENAPEGALTALADHIQSRPGAVGTNVTYSDGVLNFNSTVVSSWASTASYIDVTIGSTTYRFRVITD